jgi:Zn-dependent protease
LDFRLILLIAPVMLFSIIAHEIAHGYAALKQGDQTALAAGRLTWNPIKHIDLWLTIIVPVMLALAHQPVIGGARPVPVDPRNYRRLVLGDIIVSLAGVATNVALAVIFAIVVVLLGLVARAAPGLTTSFSILQAMLALGIWLNFGLVVFNLLPIPPLDGSHVAKYLMPRSWAPYYQRIGFLGLILIIVFMRMDNSPLDWWFRPALIATQFVLEKIAHFILPQAAAWWPALG